MNILQSNRNIFFRQLTPRGLFMLDPFPNMLVKPLTVICFSLELGVAKKKKDQLKIEKGSRAF